MRGRAPLARIAALVALIAAAVLIAVMLLRGSGSGYDVKARFQNASQVVKGNLVQVSGLPAGEVEDIRLTDDGQAELTLSIDDRYARCAAARRRRSARRRCPASPTAT